jgi:hypothetical protein
MTWMSLDQLTVPGVYWVRHESGPLRIAEYVGGRFYFVHADGSTPVSIAPKHVRYYGPLPEPDLEKDWPPR